MNKIDIDNILNTKTPKVTGNIKQELSIEGIKVDREIFAYGRVSTEQQNLAMQVSKFEMLGIKHENMFLDKDSGKKEDREQLRRMLDKLRSGDKVVFCDLSRLGRNVKHNLSLLDHFHNIGVHFQDLSNPTINTEGTRTAEGRLVYTVISAISEFMVNQSNDKVKAGLAQARKDGKQLGRPRGMSEKLANIAEAVVLMHKNPTTSIKDIQNVFGISRGSVYKCFENKGYDYKKHHKNKGNKNAEKLIQKQ